MDARDKHRLSAVFVVLCRAGGNNSGRRVRGRENFIATYNNIIVSYRGY